LQLTYKYQTLNCVNMLCRGHEAGVSFNTWCISSKVLTDTVFGIGRSTSSYVIAHNGDETPKDMKKKCGAEGRSTLLSETLTTSTFIKRALNSDRSLETSLARPGGKNRLA